MCSCFVAIEVICVPILDHGLEKQGIEDSGAKVFDRFRRAFPRKSCIFSELKRKRQLSGPDSVANESMGPQYPERD